MSAEAVRTADPEKQFMLLADHIHRIRRHFQWESSWITVFVEANLGYESEHHERNLRGMHNVHFHRDLHRGRVGVCTTLQIKHAAVQLTNTLLMEQRISLASNDFFVSLEPDSVKNKLRDQLGIYSYQFKTASTVFSKDQMALSGKVGGMKDDIAICLQMAIYHTSQLTSQAS